MDVAAGSATRSLKGVALSVRKQEPRARPSATAAPMREQTRCTAGGRPSCRNASGDAAIRSRTPACDSHTLESSNASHSNCVASNASYVRCCVSAEGWSGGDNESGDTPRSPCGLRSAAWASACIAGQEAQWFVVSRMWSAHMNSPPTTSTRTPSDLAREVFHAIFSERDLSDPSRYWTDESVDHFLALGKSVRGKDALAGFFRELFAAFPDWTLEIEQTIDDGDRRVVVQWTAGATFDGAPWQGIEPTGSKVTVRGVDVISLDSDGTVDQNTVYYDGAGFARQIGMLPREGSMPDRAVLAAFNLTTKAKERVRNRRS
jgi:steroid delta-isomerase-like uncharacterized protein